MLALRLPDGTEQRLADLAKATGRSKSYYARQAIVEHIDEIESRARRNGSHQRRKACAGLPPIQTRRKQP